MVFVQHASTSQFFKIIRADCQDNEDPVFPHGPGDEVPLLLSESNLALRWRYLIGIGVPKGSIMYLLPLQQPIASNISKQ